MKPQTQKLSGVALFLALSACVGMAVSGCEDDGVTAKCDPQPIVDENGQTITEDGEAFPESKWNDPELGAGGAINRWALENPDCATLPIAGSSND